MAPAITLTQLRKLKPCRGRMAELAPVLPKRGQITAAEAYQAGASFDDLVWVASKVARNDKDVERRLRMWMADVAAHVLHVFETTVENDQRPRNVIIAARAFAVGEIDVATLADAGDAAWEARGDAWGARDAARVAAWAARDAAGNAAWAAWGAARGAVWEAARAAAAAVWSAWATTRAARAAAMATRDATWGLAGNAARDAEKQWQLERLLAWFSDDEPEPWPLPEVQSVEVE